MSRVLAIVFGGLVVAGSAHAVHAQAFKPRGGATTKSDSTAKSDAKPAAKSTKKAAAKTAKADPDADSDADSDSDDTDKKADKKASAKKAATRTSSPAKTRNTKKSRAAKDGRPDDLTPEPASSGGKHDPDYVVITDDDEIE